jgi:hypothetical protein
LIAGHRNVVGQVFGQRPVAPAGQQLGAAPDAAVAVQRHRDFDVLEELGELVGFLRAIQR